MGECYKNEVELRGIMRLTVGRWRRRFWKLADGMDQVILRGTLGVACWWGCMEGVLRMRTDEFEVWHG